MARVTVEDCILKVPNRFELVLLAAQRARDISAGARETISRDNDKGPVVALREIAEGTIDLETLEDTVVRGLQKHAIFEDDEEDEAELVLTQGGEMEVTRAPAAASEDEDDGSEEESARDLEGAEDEAR